MNLFDPGYLNYVGTAILLVGYFIRDELKLRVMIIIATAVLNIYFWRVPDPPLWESVISGFLMIAINLYVLSQVLLDRTTLSMTEEEKRLFDAFETLTPGQFRRILKHARWKEGDSTELTREGESCSNLFYVFEGVIEVAKSGRRFRLPAGNFIGEVAFVLDGPTTATTIAPPGARFVEWEVETLRDLGKNYPALGNGLNALLTRDLAAKLTDSYRPDESVLAAG